MRIDAEQWDQALEDARAGTPFHRAAWVAAWGGRAEVTALVDGSQRVVAGILRCPRRRALWTCAARPMMTAYNGPVVLVEHPRSRRIELLSQLLEMGRRFAFEDYILEPGDVDPLPWLWSGFQHQLRLTYVIPSTRGDTWRQDLSKHHRRDLRKARRELGERSAIVVDDDPAAVAGILSQSAHQKGFSAPSADAWRRWRSACPGPGLRCYVQLVDGAAAAASVVVDDGRVAYYLAGGVDRSVAGTAPHAMLLFERMIADALGRGLDFNFEGSVLPGVEHFFRGWGGDAVPVQRVVRARSAIMRLGWAFRGPAGSGRR